MHQNLLNHKSAQFATERDTSSILYEVKKTRAIWDSGLSVPGTNRRGGWRCPPGMAFGGQITDRFGRNCGYGLVRRLGNAMNDLGERMNEGDKKRRERRIAKLGANINQPGMVERAAGRVADALETDKKPARRVRTGNIDAVKPVKPVAPVARTAKGDLKKPVVNAPKARKRVINEPKPKDKISTIAVPAGAPNNNESLEDYKKRKFNEHQAAVRKIRENGGKAGHLTRPQWDEFHGPVVEANWNKKNGIVAKKPVKPRAPKAKIADAKKEVTAEKPAVKKAAAKKPAVKKPAVKKAAIKKEATPKDPTKKDKPIDFDGIRKQLKGNGILGAADFAELFKNEKDAFGDTVPSNDIQPLALRVYQDVDARRKDIGERFAERYKNDTPAQFDAWVSLFEDDMKGGEKNILDAIDRLEKAIADGAEQDEINRLRDRIISKNRLHVANVEVVRLNKELPPRPVTPPESIVPEASDARVLEPAGKGKGKDLAKVLRVAGVKKHGKEGKIAKGDGLPPAPGELPVPHIVDSKMTSAEAIAHVKNGGDLAVVPHNLWLEAIQANLKSENNPNGKWDKLAKKGGNIGDTFIYVKLDEKGRKTNAGWVFKAAAEDDNLHELMAWNLAGAHGFDIEGAHMDGQINGRNAVVLPFAQHHVPKEWKEVKGNGNNFDKDAVDKLPDRAYPQRMAHYLHNYLLNVRDRHAGNGFAKVYAKPSGEQVAHIIPIDQGWALKIGYKLAEGIERYDLGMDNDLLSSMSRHLSRIADKKEQAKQRKAIVDAMDGIIENAQKVIKMNESDVYDWVKSMYPKGQNVGIGEVTKFWNNYNKMVKQLTKERNDIVQKIGG